MEGKAASNQHTLIPFKVGWAVALAGGIAVIALAVAYCFYAVPYADDFSYQSRVREFGYWGGINDLRSVHNSRITVFLIIFGIYAWIDLFSPAYGFFTFLFMAATFAGFYFFICTIIGARMGSGRALAVTVLFFATYWATMASPGESFYWLPDAAQGHLSFFLFSVLLVLPRAKKRLGIFPLILLSIPVGLLFSGVHELYTLIGGYIAFVLAVVLALKRSTTAFYWMTQVVLFAAGFLAIVTGAGSRFRRSSFTESGLTPSNLAHGFETLGEHLLEWVTAPVLVVLAGLWVVLIREWKKSQAIHPEWDLHPAVTAAAGGTGWILAFMGYAIATGPGAYPLRLQNILYLTFLCLVFVVLTQVVARLQLPRQSRLTGTISLLFGLAFCVTAASQANVWQGVNQLISGRAAMYHRGVDAFDLQMQMAEVTPETSVYVNNFPKAPAVLTQILLRRGNLTWRSRSQMMRYYNVMSIEEVTDAGEARMAPYLYIEWMEADAAREDLSPHPVRIVTSKGNHPPETDRDFE